MCGHRQICKGWVQRATSGFGVSLCTAALGWESAEMLALSLTVSQTAAQVPLCFKAHIQHISLFTRYVLLYERLMNAPRSFRFHISLHDAPST